MTFSILAIVVWFTLGISSYSIFSKTLVTFQNYKDDQNRWEFVTYWTALLHAIVSTGLALWVCFYGCDSGLSMFQDLQCFLDPKDIHYKTVLISAGYLVYDFVVYFFIVQARSEIAY